VYAARFSVSDSSAVSSTDDPYGWWLEKQLQLQLQLIEETHA
jgi:hypothetical protein